MRYKGFIIPRSRYLRRVSQADITRDARKRLAWMDYYGKVKKARLTCRHFGISPDTFYRWKRRYRPGNLKSLEDGTRSRRPRHLRLPTTPAAVVERILSLREQYPRWGKEKLALLLAREGVSVSVSTVGRTLARLRQRGVLKEPLPAYISGKKRFIKRSWAVRRPQELRATSPGDLVQIDTLDIRPLPGVIRKQFTARDTVSKWDSLMAYGSASSGRAAAFLEHLVQHSPFPVRGIQIDGGSEFKGEFETACREKGIPLYVLPPRRPDLNGCVERAQRTHTEEFYEVTEFSWILSDLNAQLHRWEQVYNTIRPHQALGYLTPLEYITQWKQKKEDVYGMY